MPKGCDSARPRQTHASATWRTQYAFIRCDLVNGTMESLLTEKASMSRDDFSQPVKNALARRVAMRCSNPACRAVTSGPHSAPSRSVNLGVASHITAAASGGPRFDLALTSEQRASIENAIWLCQTCAKLIDSDDGRFTTMGLRNWKVSAEAEALRALNGSSTVEFFPQPPLANHTPIPKIAGTTYDDARARLVDAGWQPRLHHWSYASEPGMQYGNGLIFWQRGYHEIIHASGTGLGHCTFGFHDVYGSKLVIVTAGEVDEERCADAYVWSWHFTKDWDED